MSGLDSIPPVLLARIGKPGSRALDGYLADGGYASWKNVLAGAKTGAWTPAKLTDMVKASGLRGRGGAGFPCGLKWTFVPTKEKRGDKPVYLLCNADESEPGTFKDRLLIEQDPHQILEGMMLAAFALEVKHAYVYIRGEMVHGAEILNAAVDEAHEKGFLGTDILGSGVDLTITIHRGAGAYICGEETALIESLEGKRGHPRIKPPFPAVSGVWGCPDGRQQRRDALLRQAHRRPRRRLVQGRRPQREEHRAEALRRLRPRREAGRLRGRRLGFRGNSCSRWRAACAADGN